MAGWNSTDVYPGRSAIEAVICASISLIYFPNFFRHFLLTHKRVIYKKCIDQKKENWDTYHYLVRSQPIGKNSHMGSTSAFWAGFSSIVSGYFMQRFLKRTNFDILEIKVIGLQIQSLRKTYWIRLLVYPRNLATEPGLWHESRRL